MTYLEAANFADKAVDSARNAKAQADDPTMHLADAVQYLAQAVGELARQAHRAN
ncbi:hypothetical protein ACFVKB_34935 [Rhodococcus sp. NPDC127530]|uniref:hypothetical protein n=1 Tax=unclassified Rhodococcus (in: high G+C Gram-positive bacteria) TaxID=192944 RepID=UPI00362B70C3